MPRDSAGGGAYGRVALTGECDAIRNAPFGRQEGTLNASCFKIGSLVAGGELDADVALADLLAAARSVPSQPGKDAWSPAELERKVRRAFQDGLGSPREAGRQSGPPPSPSPAQGGARTAPLGPIVEAYNYEDEAGNLLFQVTRFDQPEKTFRQRRRPRPGEKAGKDGWVGNLQGVRRVLYRLPELLAADPAILVFVAEGEKDVNNLRQLGLVATCNPMGAGTGKWLPDFSPYLAGRDVVVLPDDDEAGRPHGRDVAAKLTGHAARVRILLMPAPHKDVSDWIAAGGTPAQLLALVETAAVPAEAASSAPPQEAPEPQPADLTEDGVALAFAAAHAGRVVFDHTERRWAEWDGSRWRRDGKERVFDGVRAYVRRIRESVDEAPRSLARMGFAAAVERGVRADQRIAVEHDVWDADPWALGVPGGVVDLRTGTLRAGRPEQYISRQTSVAPTERVDCPRWLQFMDEVTAGDAELTRFLRQWGGYCLTGDTREEALLFMYGPGGNGKGKFLSAMQGILGDYCCTAAMETFTASGGDKHPTDLAMLRGARMVCASETDEGRAWAEVRIKQMTGNDVISARFMRQDFFQYRPQFKLTIIGNHKPVLRNVDDAARRRFNIVPFNFKPPRPDLELEAKLKAERPGILRWMIEGCLDWQANGLIRPQVVVDATAEYFEAQDLLAHWLTERCQEQATAEAASSALYRDWSGWARDRGEEPGTNKAFSAAMERRHPKRRTKTGAVFLGLRLRPSEGGVW